MDRLGYGTREKVWGHVRSITRGMSYLLLVGVALFSLGRINIVGK
jgi:hypothetical protein